MDMHVTLNFENQTISGMTIITMKSFVDTLYDIILDTKGMEIFKVTNIFGEPLKYEIREGYPALGNILHIYLENAVF